MTALSPLQVAALWTQAGGPASTAVIATVVAWAESGGNTDAVSASDDFGLWQINALVWGQEFGGAGALLEDTVNARAAVHISSWGGNWAAWCTMWANPQRDCGHGQISIPQQGSAAYAVWPQIAAVLGGAYPPPSAGGGGGTGPVSAAWDGIRTYAVHGAPTTWAGIQFARHTNAEARRRML